LLLIQEQSKETLLLIREQSKETLLLVREQGKETLLLVPEQGKEMLLLVEEQDCPRSGEKTPKMESAVSRRAHEKGRQINEGRISKAEICHCCCSFMRFI